jgi:hypothetical protein
VLHMQCPQKQSKDDDTDFREWGKDVYDAREKDCVFFATYGRKQE